MRFFSSKPSGKGLSPFNFPDKFKNEFNFRTDFYKRLKEIFDNIVLSHQIDTMDTSIYILIQVLLYNLGVTLINNTSPLSKAYVKLPKEMPLLIDDSSQENIWHTSFIMIQGLHQIQPVNLLLMREYLLFLKRVSFHFDASGVANMPVSFPDTNTRILTLNFFSKLIDMYIAFFCKEIYEYDTHDNVNKKHVSVGQRSVLSEQQKYFLKQFIDNKAHFKHLFATDFGLPVFNNHDLNDTLTYVMNGEAIQPKKMVSRDSLLSHFSRWMILNKISLFSGSGSPR